METCLLDAKVVIAVLTDLSVRVDFYRNLRLAFQLLNKHSYQKSLITYYAEIYLWHVYLKLNSNMNRIYEIN